MIYQLQVPGTIGDVIEVRVLQWHAQLGQSFGPGELIVEMETHKALVEIRAAQGGVLRQAICVEGDWKNIGAILAIVSDTADEPLPDMIDGLPILPLGVEII